MRERERERGREGGERWGGDKQAEGGGQGCWQTYIDKGMQSKNESERM